MILACLQLSVRALIALVATACFIECGCADDALVNALTKAQSSREQFFMNGHFVWMEREVEGKKLIEQRHEYWARNGEYFRRDSQDVADGKGVGKVSRTVVGPEGFWKIAADSTSDSGVIYNFGKNPKGRDSILGQYFIALANRVSTVQVRTWNKRICMLHSSHTSMAISFRVED